MNLLCSLMTCIKVSSYMSYEGAAIPCPLSWQTQFRGCIGLGFNSRIEVTESFWHDITMNSRSSSFQDGENNAAACEVVAIILFDGPTHLKLVSKQPNLNLTLKNPKQT